MATLPVERQSFEDALAALFDGYALSSDGGGTILPTRLSIINVVKLKLDELLPEGEGVQFALETEPNVTNPLDLFINGILDECTKQVMLMAPIHILTPLTASPTVTTITTYPNGRKSCSVELPADFLRLHTLKLSDWERAVNIPGSVSDSRYKRQGNQWMCGTISKPEAFLAHRNVSGTVKRILEAYTTLVAVPAIGQFLYIAETLPENLQDNIVDALTWYAAGRILQITERLDLAQKATEMVTLCFNNM